MVGPLEAPDTSAASSASPTSPRTRDPVWTAENITTAPEYSPRAFVEPQGGVDARRLGMPDAVTALAHRGSYRSVVIASGSLLPLTRMSTVRICEVGMLVAAESPLASSPAGFHEPTGRCTPSCVVTTMS